MREDSIASSFTLTYGSREVDEVGMAGGREVSVDEHGRERRTCYCCNDRRGPFKKEWKGYFCDECIVQIEKAEDHERSKTNVGVVHPKNLPTSMRRNLNRQWRR